MQASIRPEERTCMVDDDDGATAAIDINDRLERRDGISHYYGN